MKSQKYLKNVAIIESPTILSPKSRQHLPGNLLLSKSTSENLVYVWNGADDTIHGRVEHRFGTRDLRTSSGGFQNRKQNYKITTTFE